MALCLAMVSQDTILDALKTVKYPGYSRDIVSFGLVKDIQVAHGDVAVFIQLSSSGAGVAEQIKGETERVLKSLPGINRLSVDVQVPSPGQTHGAANPFANQARVPGIKQIIAIASGKGGVGKSTCAANLACALQHAGSRTGLLDCDIYGPSIPLMMGVHEKPTVSAAEKLVPPVAHSVKVMSIGL